MNTLEKKFHDEIEVERFWVTTEQGEYVVFTMLPISMLLIFGLWDTTTHTLLLGWFALLTAINFFRWRVLRFYHAQKAALIADIGKFKHQNSIGFCTDGFVLGAGHSLVPSAVRTDQCVDHWRYPQCCF